MSLHSSSTIFDNCKKNGALGSGSSARKDAIMNDAKSQVSQINLSLDSTKSVHTEMDIQDALYKINTFLNQYHSHFTQKLTYDKNNIQGFLDMLSMQCSVIPRACRGSHYTLIGFLYSSLDKTAKADRYFDMAIKLNPDDIVGITNKARNYVKMGQILRVYPLIHRLKEITAKTAFLPGQNPHSSALATIALAYNKLGLSCAAKRLYDKSLQLDSLNYESWLGKGEVQFRLSSHQGRASNEENLNECIFNLRRYISEFNVMNLAKEKDPRLSPLPRDNKVAVILLARALNERARRSDKTNPEGSELLDMVLDYTEDSNAYVLYEIGDEKRLMDELEGPRGALFLLKEAMSQRENCQIYHAYALALLSWERKKYYSRVNQRAPSKMSEATQQSKDSVEATDRLTTGEANPEPRKKSTKASCKSVDKVKQFVFEGDDELREGYLKAAKLLKHAVKISYGQTLRIALDLGHLYCSLNRKTEAEAMYSNAMLSSNTSEKEEAFRKFGMYMIKTDNMERGEEMIDKALTLRQHVHLEDECVEELEGVVTLLSEHFSYETNGKGKYWLDRLGELNPELVEEAASRKTGSKHDKKR